MALVESDDRLRAIAEHSADLIIEVDDQGCFLFASRRATELLGVPEEELIGKPMSGHAVHPDDRSADYFERFMQGIAEGRTAATFEARIRQPGGGWRWLESRFTAYRARDGRWRTIVISRDITDRVEAEQGLRESEERYRVLTEASGEIVAEASTDGRILYASPVADKVLGRAHDDTELGFDPARIHPEDLAHVRECFRRAAEAGLRSATGPYRVQHADGSWIWLETEAVPFAHGDGERRVLLLGRNVTERQNLEERIRQSQRLESLGVLAGGIAHDFNNLLTPILGDASLALSDLPEGSKIRPALQRIQRAARRAATLTQQMLSYAGKGPLQMEALDLSTLVAEMTQLLQTTVARKARLITELADDLPAVDGDASQLCQVVMNVISNAAEAIEGGDGEIVVRTGVLDGEVSLGGLWQGHDLPSGPVVFFEVIDNGSGMDDETKARIFDPFFTTKFTGRGLGLAAALGIVRGHGGALEIDSQPGQGTHFRMLLPASQSTAVSDDAAGPASPWTGSGTTLVIDDDEGVRELVEETFTRAGLRVMLAATAEEGIATFEAHAQEIDLVVLDRTMPTRSGTEVADALRRIDPSARILLISGYADERAMASLAERRVTDFLQKPFLPETLLERARQLLGS